MREGGHVRGRIFDRVAGVHAASMLQALTARVWCFVLGEIHLIESSPRVCQEPDWKRQKRIATEIILTNEEQTELVKLTRSRLTSVRLEQRAGIVLLAADGFQINDIAEILGIGRLQVARWRERCAQNRLAGIERDLSRGASPVTVDVTRLMALTTQSTPEDATHWSSRTMAAQIGVSAASVSRHWRAHGLKPHLARGFKVSRDPKFAEKL